MGRMVWFTPPLVAAGFAVSPLVLLSGIGALGGLSFWCGSRRAARAAGR